MELRQELRRLLEQFAELALDNIDEYDFQVPLAVANDLDGKRIYFAADKFDAPDDESYDFVACRRSVADQVRQWAADGKIWAVALGWDVTCTVDGDDGPVRTRALEVVLDHARGGGCKAYLTFRTEGGKAVPGQLLYQDLHERLFPPYR